MYIEIRTLDKTKKYYLAHSFRKGTRVRKLRFYLGVNLSKGELSRRISHAKAMMEERIKRYETIIDPFYTTIKSSELQEIKSLEPTGDIKVMHLTEKDWSEFTKAFAYDTNAIEGSTVTFAEVSEILERNEWPKDRTKLEISETYGVSEAIEFIRKTKEHISSNLIKELHRIVFKNSKPFAGKFRSKGTEVAVVDALGNIMHRGAPSMQIVKLLKELINWYKKNKKKYPPLVLAVVVHNHFETIHPFQDGNGRIGRILLNNILLKHGLPPVNIELKHRQEYYKALQNYQKTRNIRPMIELILKEYRELKRMLGRR